VDELTRFARHLIEQLGVSSEGSLQRLSVAALRETVLPYRKHRRALGVESVEDYETVLLRLVAGERGFLRTVPAEAAERCRNELAQTTPDLAVLDEVAGATVQVTSMAAAQIVDDGAVRAVEAVGEVSPVDPPKRFKVPARTPRPDRTDRPTAPTPPPPPPSPSSPTSPSCRHCDHALPSERQVVFCPWCGQRLIPFTCARCGTELSSEWRHCITCGAEVKDPFRYV